MNKGIFVFGVILLIIGCLASVYKVEVVTHSEPGLLRKWVPLNEVESMTEQGWEELGEYGHEGEILMVKKVIQKYYIEVYPYQLIGVIFLIIGFVVAVISFLIEKA